MGSLGETLHFDQKIMRALSHTPKTFDQNAIAHPMTPMGDKKCNLCSFIEICSSPIVHKIEHNQFAGHVEIEKKMLVLGARPKEKGGHRGT